MSGAPPAVHVQDLCKHYGTRAAVDGVSFEVAPGEIFGLLGPNGSGKTTTVECVQGLRRADGGQLEVFGHDPRREPARVRRMIGSQLQDAALPDRIKVWEALRLFSVLSPQGPHWEQLLTEWGLESRRDAAFADLSGGQQQRLFVALALVGEPRLVILDEMTTGLDAAARRVAWDLVTAVRDRGATVLLVTHFMDEAERLCDRVAVLSSGRVVATGTPSGLVTGRTDRSVVRFTAPDGTDLSFLRGVPLLDSLDLDHGRVRATGHGPLLARIAHALVEQGVEPDDLRVDLPTFEDAYLALTSAPAHGSDATG